jgi:hypothetical protein
MSHNNEYSKRLHGGFVPFHPTPELLKAAERAEQECLKDPDFLVRKAAGDAEYEEYKARSAAKAAKAEAAKAAKAEAKAAEEAEWAAVLAVPDTTQRRAKVTTRESPMTFAERRKIAAKYKADLAAAGADDVMDALEALDSAAEFLSFLDGN